MDSARNPNREFSPEVRKQEKINANYACRICGSTKEQLPLQLAHIYTLSLNSQWKRTGTDDQKWSDDKYIKSYQNALLLCIHHHKKIDSEQGLIKCSVAYCQSLKSNLTTCTALITNKGKYRRCKLKSKHYRCHLHVEGGKEETFIVRNSFGYDPDSYKPINPSRININSMTEPVSSKRRKKAKKSGCIIV